MSSASLPIHPDTGLTALGLTSKGRPIWPVLGGDGTGDGNTGDAPAGEDTDPGDGGDGDGEAVDQVPEGGNGGGEDTTGSGGQAPAGSQSSNPALRQARNEAATYRTKATALEQQLAEAQKNAGAFDALRQQLGKALGYVDDDEQPDPKKLAADLATQAQAAKESQIQLAVYRAAAKKGADPEALLDSRGFLAALDKFDPSADDLLSLVGAEITKAVEKNPRYKLAPQTPPPPGRSGTDTSGGQGENSAQLTPEQYRALSPAERQKATREGRANRILGRT